MKTTRFSSLATVALVLLTSPAVWTCCRGVEDADSPATVSLKIKGPATRGPLSGYDPAALDSYHLKIELTNPTELHYVFDYTLGEEVSVDVLVGDGRVIDVEMYYVPSFPPPLPEFPADHYVTVTPEGDRTISLGQDEGREVEIELDYDPLQIGTVVGDTPFYLDLDGEALELGGYSDCPSGIFWLTVSDQTFGGLTFPEIPVVLFSDTGPPRLSLSRFPLETTYTVGLHHDGMGVDDVFTVSIGNSADPVAYVNSLSFTGFENGRIRFSPEWFTDEAPNSMASTIPYVEGGMGFSGEVPNLGEGEENECEIISFGGFQPPVFSHDIVPMFQEITFVTPEAGQRCLLHVTGTDCGGAFVEGKIVVTSSDEGGGSLCGNDACDFTTGDPPYNENNSNCPADCFCGDGFCHPLSESFQSCVIDCGY